MMITNLKVGDEVSWNGDTWTVTECGCEREPMPDGSMGGLLACIENATQGRWTVRESECTITAWAPAPIARAGDEARPS